MTLMTQIRIGAASGAWSSGGIKERCKISMYL